MHTNFSKIKQNSTQSIFLSHLINTVLSNLTEKAEILELQEQQLIKHLTTAANPICFLALTQETTSVLSLSLQNSANLL